MRTAVAISALCLNFLTLGCLEGCADAVQNSQSQYETGLMYFKGEGDARNYPEALKWFRMAAEQGNVKAQLALGEMYRDCNIWLKKYQDSLEKVVPVEMRKAYYTALVGEMYIAESVIMKDNRETMKWFRIAAEQGDAKAQFFLSDMCDKQEALIWLRKAADQGHVMSQYFLGSALFFKAGCDSKECAEALKWFCVAAQRGDVMSQVQLGTMYQRGDGIKKDSAEALKWFQMAAEAGSPLAQYALGKMYSEGDGLPKNDVCGYSWLNLAAMHIDDAAKARDALGETMTMEQIAEAQRVSAAFVCRKCDDLFSE